MGVLIKASISKLASRSSILFRARFFTARVLIAFAVVFSISSGLAETSLTEARLLFGPIVKENCVAPLRVKIKTDQPFEGQLVVSDNGQPRNGPTSFTPISVGEGKFQFDLPVVISPDQRHGEAVFGRRSLNVELRRRDGWTVQARGVAIKPVSGGFVSGYWQGPSPLIFARVGSKTVQDARAFKKLATLGPGVCFSRVFANHLSDNWKMYLGLSGLIFSKGAFAEKAITKRQANGIYEWVRSGGCLIICADCFESKKERARAAALFKRFDIAVDANPRQVDDMTLYSVRVGPKVVTDAYPGVAYAQCGFGSVAVSPVRLTSVLRKFPERKRIVFLARLLGFTTDSPELLRSALVVKRLPRPMPWFALLWSWINLRPIPISYVLIYLALFMIAVTFGERLVLKRIGKLNWTWGITAGLVVAFSAVACLVSYGTRGVSSRLSEFSTRDYVDGATNSVSYNRALACFVPSVSKIYSLDAGEGGSLVSLSSGENLTAYNLRDNTLSFVTPVWSPRFVAGISASSDPLPFAADDARALLGKLSGTLKAQTPGQTFESVFVRYRNAVYACQADPKTPGVYQIGAETLWSELDDPLKFYLYTDADRLNGLPYYPEWVFGVLTPPIPILNDDDLLVVAKTRARPVIQLKGAEPKTDQRDYVRQIIHLENRLLP